MKQEVFSVRKNPLDSSRGEVNPDALQKWLGDDLFEIYFGVEEEA